MGSRASSRTACTTPRACEQTTRVVAWLALLAACALAACDADRPFCAVAVYEAPRSGFRLAVAARGIVEAGHDLAARSSGEISVCSTAGNPDRREVSWAHADAPTRTLRDELAGRLGRAGYRSVDEQELQESADVIAGVLHGPKATRVEGQTRVLKLVRYERCDAVPSSDRAAKTLAEYVRGCKAGVP